MEQKIDRNQPFHHRLENKMDDYVHYIYKISRKFPKEELYGVISQIRRAALSIILNYIEGYARMKSKVYQNFLEISYGSLKESKYLLKFSYEEKYITENEFQTGSRKADEIGAMLWRTIKGLKQ